MDIKDRILMFLLENSNQNISGEKIANVLYISRTAVWKAINKLKKLGHKIDSNGNKGYHYKKTDIISEGGIRYYLNEKTINIPIRYLDKIDSTNKIAKIEAPNNKNEKTIYVTANQSDGIGRFGRSFFGEKDGGIYLSIVLKPSKPLKNIPLITIKTAIAAKRVIDKVAKVDIKIKWVNDLFLSGKKVAGILTEGITDYETMSVSTIIVGIGINFFMKEFPIELREIAGSIFEEKPKDITKNQLIGDFISEFFTIFDEEDNEKIIDEYKNALFILGKKIMFTKNNKNYNGTATDITKNGELVVLLEDKKEIILNSGEISIKI